MSNVSHPAHYNQGKVEVIEFIEDQKLGYHLGNAMKYISRAGKKNPAALTEDLQKAIWYIQRFIEIQKENPRRPNAMNPQEGDVQQMSFTEVERKIKDLKGEEPVQEDVSEQLKRLIQSIQVPTMFNNP